MKNQPSTALSTLLILTADIYVVLVIKTFEREKMSGNGINALKPLVRADDKSGVADPDEVMKVVVKWSVSILSASTTINLKFAFFSNLLKMTLQE